MSGVACPVCEANVEVADNTIAGELLATSTLASQHLDGCSLMSPIFDKPNEELNRRFLAWSYPHKHGSGHTPSNAIREGDWKLIHRLDSGLVELYNLQDDIGETTNLAKREPEIASKLKKKLLNWVEQTTLK